LLAEWFQGHVLSERAATLPGRYYTSEELFRREGTVPSLLDLRAARPTSGSRGCISRGSRKSLIVVGKGRV
jgi:hypothetical protein